MRQNKTDITTFYLLILIAVLLPWSNALTMLLLIPLGIVAILRLKHTSYQEIIFWPGVLITVLFLVNLAACFVQPNVLDNLQRVLGLAPLIMIPVFVKATSAGITTRARWKLLKAFSFSTLLMAGANYIGGLVNGYRQYNSIAKAIAELKYDVFSMALVHHHQLYMAMYLTFAAILFFYLVLGAKNNKSRFLYVFSLATTLFLMVILSVRMAMLTLLVSFVYLILKRQKALFFKAILISGVCVIPVVAYKMNPEFKRRVDFITEFSFEYNYHEDWTYQGLALRLMNWECSWSVAKKNFFYGVGVANVQQELDSCYLEKKFDSILWFQKNQGSKFNSHNMFLQTLVSSGVIGLILFVLSIGMLFVLALKQKNLLLQIFLISFCLQGLTESLLYREKGILFFAFFCSLLLLYPNKDMQTLPTE
ncbi:O-Antigen Polymerase family [Croceitalea dokdonensis DOKDO 023]|uniref:O-Antigen Polymerase family n=1 Tax=Croceitalea dokdonensis DOKDO 023 TaxID=1300341 RepID=A0A0P7AQB5_9FLAO|nr:O-antigen ligase family protein [Croceitalea dokdonensis]KPM30957.1 O-Antigen Polymerase family [Croceitalea dokdonensis DOKDO 023]